MRSFDREYRVWDKFQRKMLKDDIGLLPSSDHTGMSFYSSGGRNIALINISYESCIVMDFTGKKDKKGNKIFEGDLIRYAYSSRPGDIIEGQVRWNEEYTGFSPFVDTYPDKIIVIEVIGIGNIFDT